MINMNIAQVSTGISQANIASEISMKVAKVGMNLAQQTGNQIMEMVKGMEMSINANLGSKIDVRV